MADTIDGGLRYRYLLDSFRGMVHGGLTELGWFDAGRRHRPVRLIGTAANWDEVIEPNLLAISAGETEDRDLELGSALSSTTTPIFIDLYAESESLGIELSGDIRDLVRGRVPAVGRTQPIFDVIDSGHEPSTKLGYALISDVDLTKQATHFDRAWLQNWYTVTCRLVDFYSPTGLGGPLFPDPDLFPGLEVFPEIP